MLHRVYGGAVPVEVLYAAPITPTAPVVPDDDLYFAALLWHRLPRAGTMLLCAGALALAQAVVDDPPDRPGLTW